MKLGYYVLAAVIILVDQWTKELVVRHMELYDSIPLVKDLLYLTSHRNKGAAWGIMQGQMWFFYIITVIVVIGIIYFLVKHTKDEPFLGWPLSLILGGAIGNFIDRVFRGEVVDFIDVYIFSYNYPIFNIADSALVVGAFTIIIATLFDNKKKEEPINE
jgi:signal peptidase II